MMVVNFRINREKSPEGVLMVDRYAAWYNDDGRLDLIKDINDNILTISLVMAGNGVSVTKPNVLGITGVEVRASMAFIVEAKIFVPYYLYLPIPAELQAKAL